MNKGQKNLIAKMEAYVKSRLMQERLFTIQQCKDMMLIAVNEEFGFGEDRAKRLGDAFDRTFEEYADLTIADAGADKAIEYTKAKVDAKLQRICGKYFSPWAERYGE